MSIPSELGHLEMPIHFITEEKMKVGDIRYEARSRGRSSPDSLVF